MPPSTKRSQRARREVINNVDIPDSSPSRPAKRRKRVEEPAEKTAPEPEPVKLPLDRSDLSMNDEELIQAVVPTLLMPPHPVQASKDHDNALYEIHNKEGVQAYAKLAAKGWTFYVKNLINVIGRPPEGLASGAQTQSNTIPGETAGQDVVHIDLGPNKMVSRLHAEIYFDSDSERWNIHVQGRNGIRINDQGVRKGTRDALVSGQIIEIGGVEMMFVLPQEEGSLQVANKYLARAGLIQPDEDKGDETDAPSSSQPLSGPAARGQNNSGPLPIAPAPPDYRRPGTPVSARTKHPYSIGKSPAYAGGTMLMNADDVDLSLDSNQHIKPSYSYAQMISQAILDTEEEKLNLSGIYTFIQEKFAYYRYQAGGGWQNSIRHNLSLNKAFHKVARSTDEPGKGMKWCIVPEVRDEMAKNCVRGGRGGHRGSSAPGTPANINSIGRASKMGETGSTIKGKRSPQSPPSSAFQSHGPQFTPDRRGRPAVQDDLPGDGSPLPRHRRPNTSALGLSENAPGSPPALSSSYLQEESGSMQTPAPHRVIPHLAPPSTAQRPSQHMPTSSPAPFWKFAELGGATPMKGPAFDMSPTKGGDLGVPPSSSPPPARASAASPSRNGRSTKLEAIEADEAGEDEEEGGFDLSRGFQSIGSYHAPVGSGVFVAPPT